MDRTRLPFLAALVGFLAPAWGLAATAAPSAVKDVFLDVVVANRVFGAGAAPRLTVRTREAVNLDCLVYDAAQNLVAHRAAEGVSDHLTLDLASLPPVPKGVWLFCLVASDRARQRLSVYPQTPGGGELIQVRESSLDPENKRIQYVLPRAACVRVRVGFHEGLYLQPILAGEVQAAGPHTVAWDGTGQGGLFTNLYRHPSVQASILALSLPVNILATEDRSQWRAEGSAPAPSPSLPAYLADLKQPPWFSPGTEVKPPGYLIADDYTLALEAQPDAATRIVEIRVDCSPANRGRLFNKRFELMLFLDTTFLVEDERSQLPFSYRMSTRGLAPGRHILTANVIDADSAVGTVSREFTISKP